MNGPKNSTPITMQELADIAGVTRGTISRALSDSPRVNAETKARIHALAKQHNYHINQKARNFRLGRTGVISVVFMLNIKSEQHMSDPFFLEMLGGIADCLAEHDMDLFLSHAPILNILELQDSRIMQNSDGVIFIGQGEQHNQLNAISTAKTPIVVWGAPMEDQQYCRVGGDNIQGGYLATSHLLNLGRRHIAFFGDIKLPEIALRFAGYKKALQEQGVEFDPRLQIEVPFEMARARKAIEELLGRGIRFDGAVCSSDVMALGVIATINASGMNVPEDIAVVGYDDIGLAQYSNPALTTVRQNIRWGGRVLVESLLSIINGQAGTDTTLTSELIVRQSSGAKVANPRPRADQNMKHNIP
ncbi:LacI family DNA-binding transcriptional regulator [Pseudomonadales bacterium]|uniref:LacI family DNA-binding transcriptional regulator n=1 Tax=Reinekea sp. TaxID=1970455 RepID=UPI00232575B9|nr:LacI family DNA-binding transcriptional regulator [Reinekea sp.]MDA9285465.1 LacI family DNA-binding transcriptional regulator [Pseudomonadales bacterium]MDA9298205.1 LacI family DNA-binding transcriptional regulator [Pseudomonadales bacterium]MDB4069325.1 LacI family DNA-binding transcriptional regulator [Pseudomonadales bacterium]MDB4151090.1 LacI family DNA-binding transcriptional regulator [Pseudomonadales bacterium]MDB9868532.1 LacI family DNA-binding transcriptional regulator [Pseudom